VGTAVLFLRMDADRSESMAEFYRVTDVPKGFTTTVPVSQTFERITAAVSLRPLVAAP
jgi:hypothetical protein